MGVEIKRIFVLDDEDPITHFCTEILHRRGYRVVSQPYGPEAVELARLGDFELLLTDHKMPDILGLDLFREIKAGNEGLSCVLMSAHFSEPLAAEAMEAGVDALLYKPFTGAELLEAVNSALASDTASPDSPWHKRLSSLLELNMRLAFDSGADSAMAIAADVTGKSLSADRVALMLKMDDSDSHHLKIAACRGLPADYRPGAVAEADGTVAGYVLENGKKLLINRNKAHQSLEIASKLRCKEVKAGICVPLLSMKRPLGVLTASRIGTEEEFAEADLDLMSEIAGNIAEWIAAPGGPDSLKDACVAKIKTYVDDMDSKQAYLSGHSSNVSLFAAAIGKALGLGEREIEDLRIAGILHDIGKLAVPEQLTLKSVSWTASERAGFRAHASHGEEMVRSAGLGLNVSLAVKHHHERYDGGGYPDGLMGEGIPFEARILAVADMLDAITSDRLYRPMLTPEGVREELAGARQTQLDPMIADAAMELYNSGVLLPPDHPHSR